MSGDLKFDLVDEKYQNELRLVKGGKLTPASHIFVKLQNNLLHLKTEEKNGFAKQEITQLVNRISQGDRAEENLQFKHISAKTKSKIHFALRQANNEYQNHCKHLKSSYQEILQKYQDYTNKSTYRGSRFSRYWNNHTYRGLNNNEKTFIQLIDRIAIIDGSGQYVGELIKFLDESLDFSFEKQAEFLEKLYAIFTNIEKAYYQELKRRDDQNKIDLDINDEIYKQGVYRDYEATEIIGKGKLEFDLFKIKCETDASKEELEKQTKALKKLIHHWAQERNLPCKIVKCIEEEKEDVYHSSYIVTQDPERIKYLIDEQQQKERLIKENCTTVAAVGSGVTSLGEGLIGGVGLASLLPMVPLLVILLVAGIAGWYCNYFLFRDDTDTVLREIFLTKIVNGKTYPYLFLDKNGQPLSSGKLALVIGFGLCAIGTGFACAGMSFICTSSSMAFIVGIFTANNLAITVISMVSAAFPAIFCALAITSIFFRVIDDFIKNDRIKDIRNYFIEKYYAPWDEMNGKEKRAHIGHCFFEAAKLIIGIGIVAIVTFASLGVFYKDGLGMLQKIKDFSGAKVLTMVMTFLNAFTSSPFQIKSVTQQIGRIGATSNTFTKLTYKPSQEIELSPLQRDDRAVKRVEKVAAMATIAINGGGQAGQMYVSNHILLPGGSTLTVPINPTVMETVTGSGAFIYSSGPNASAMEGSIEQATVKPLFGKKHKDSLTEPLLTSSRSVDSSDDLSQVSESDAESEEKSPVTLIKKSALKNHWHCFFQKPQLPLLDNETLSSAVYQSQANG